MTHLDQMNEHIAQMQSWLFDGDMADDDPDTAAQHYANAERARKSAQLYALASIAESLPRIASTVGNVSFDLEQPINAVRTSPWQ